MDNQEFIEKISSALEKYYDEIDWEDVAKNCNLINIIGSYNYDKNTKEEIFFKWDSINQIILNVFYEDKDQLTEMLNYIEKTHSSIIPEYIFKNIEKILLGPEPDPLKIFISYSSENSEEGERIYNFFKKFEFDCFLSGCSLESGKSFPKQILSKIAISNIYLLLYSEDYNTSPWCIQESGISFLRREFDNSILIPILLDTTTPKGFLRDIQGEKYNDSFDFFIKIGEKIDEKFFGIFSSKLNSFENQIKINLRILENENDTEVVVQLFDFFKDHSMFMSNKQVRTVLLKYVTYDNDKKFLCEEVFYFLAEEHDIDLKLIL